MPCDVKSFDFESKDLLASQFLSNRGIGEVLSMLARDPSTLCFF
jgi:hypothetical protein